MTGICNTASENRMCGACIDRKYKVFPVKIGKEIGLGKFHISHLNAEQKCRTVIVEPEHWRWRVWLVDEELDKKGSKFKFHSGLEESGQVQF